ncbi:MAG: ABC transporter ATP-binding protein [Firmicutes bacterium]|nr:ABC transporter ATP-binding protein [Bacillota bacterium]
MNENNLENINTETIAPILQAVALKKRYGSCLALDALDFSLTRGRIIGLLGPNGSGKTTLLKLACGLLQPSSGKIVIDNHTPGIYSKSITAYLPDKPYLNDWMRVQQLIKFFSELYADFCSERAYEMLDALGIDCRARLKTLSKGTKEKVQLILVMSRKAQLYLLDEPIGGVDPAAREYIVNTIIGNYSENATVLISTHIISDIEPVLDEVIFLNRGKITLQTTVDDLRAERGKSVDEMFREVFKC